MFPASRSRVSETQLCDNECGWRRLRWMRIFFLKNKKRSVFSFYLIDTQWCCRSVPIRVVFVFVSARTPKFELYRWKFVPKETVNDRTQRERTVRLRPGISETVCLSAPFMASIRGWVIGGSRRTASRPRICFSSLLYFPHASRSSSRRPSLDPFASIFH